MLAELIELTSLVIWDEALMTHRRCFEALDRSLHDVMAGYDESAGDRVFGGKVVVLGGDFRQILPVVEGGNHTKIVSACILNSPIWKFIEILCLKENMRLKDPSLDSAAQIELKQFSPWLLATKKCLLLLRIKSQNPH